MKIIVIGYGRVGSQFLSKIDTQAHDVVIVDKDRSAIGQRGTPRGAKFVLGNAIDEDLLRTAGADSADVMLALTRDENTNLMIAQIARALFNVPKVIAVVYDPLRESYFHEAGVETLAIGRGGVDPRCLVPKRRAGNAGALASARDCGRIVLRHHCGRRPGGLLSGPRAAANRA
jgi:Trk K+ transport system NAD-binding subunit